MQFQHFSNQIMIEILYRNSFVIHLQTLPAEIPQSNRTHTLLQMSNPKDIVPIPITNIIAFYFPFFSQILCVKNYY